MHAMKKGLPVLSVKWQLVCYAGCAGTMNSWVARKLYVGYPFQLRRQLMKCLL